MDSYPPEEVANILTHQCAGVQIQARNTRRGLFDPVSTQFLRSLSAAEPASVTVARLLGFLVDVNSLTAGGFADRVGVAFRPVEPTRANGGLVYLGLDLKERSRFQAHVGTDVGNGEGSAHASLLWRNLFGGLETLRLESSAGTRTRSAYTATLDTPVPRLLGPTARVGLDLSASTVARPWASHDELCRGAAARLSWSDPRHGFGALNRVGWRHELTYSAAWRRITALDRGASRSVRAEAGDSVKSAVRWVASRDARDHPHLPRSGYLVRTVLELAGAGPLGGDVSFAKSEFDLSAAAPLPAGVSLAAGLRLGLLCPLPSSFASTWRPSRINDRFQVGGPADVRGFQLAGLGPHDGSDALGGDVLAAANLGLLLPLPYTGADSRLRLHLFTNGGRLVALSAGQHDQDSPAPALSGALDRALHNIALGGPPSIAAGVGLVYGSDIARFEINFSLPLIVRTGERPIKGLQVGFGINFM